MYGSIESYNFSSDGYISRNGEVIVPENGMVTLHLTSGTVTDKAAKFFVIAWSKMLRIEHLDCIQIFFNDENENNLGITNISYYFAPSLECHVHRGYYVIPGFTCYAVNERGDLLNRITGRTKVWTKTKPVASKNITGGYAYSFAVNDFGKSTALKRHRVLLLTFKPPQQNPSTLWVNHSDGVPGNDTFDNLEWMTPGENNKHAYRTGLTTKALVSVLVKNAVTEEVIRFSSIQTCAEHFASKHSTINRRIDLPHIAFHGYVFKRDDGSEWPLLQRVSVGKPDEVKVVCRDVFTGEIRVFDNLVTASRMTGAASQHISDHVAEKRIKPLGGYNFRLFSSEVSFPNHHPNSLRTHRIYLRNSPRGIISEDGAVYFESFFEFMKIHGVKKHVGIKLGQGPVVINGTVWKSFIHEDNLGEEITVNF